MTSHIPTTNTHSVYCSSYCIFAKILNPLFTTELTLLQLSNSIDYLPIVLQLVFAVILVGIIIVATSLLGPKRQTKDKLENFESGIESKGNARQPMAIKYFLVAILFVLFDVEVIFFYPYAVNFHALGWDGFIAVSVFVGLFICGLIYVIKKGGLNWED